MHTTPTLTFWDRFWNDKDGNPTISQIPNIPLIVWLVSLVAMNLLRQGSAHVFFDTIAHGALFTWACMEAFQGDSYYRRILGIIALAYVILFKFILLKT